MKIFVTGIGTGVGKTIVSAILCEAFGADYWKPVQAGNLNATDTMRVKRLVTSQKCFFHPESYRLRVAASPHQAAIVEGKKIQLKNIKLPETSNHLIIEGAGGVMVPLNQNTLTVDFISRFDFPVVLVSRHYLGSINHTLLTVEALKSRGLNILGIVFNGTEEKHTERIILRASGLKMIGRVRKERVVNRKVIAVYAGKFRKAISDILP